MDSMLSISISSFLKLDSAAFVGHLSLAHSQSGHQFLRKMQTTVWNEEYDLLKNLCEDLAVQLPESADWHLVIEYTIPRRQKRPDAIILAGSVIFVLEFKFHATSFDRAGQWQVLDYCLDLRDFHLMSSGRSIIPILVATGAGSGSRDSTYSNSESLSIATVQLETASSLCPRIVQLYEDVKGSSLDLIDPDAWCNSEYRPVLSIIEAAEALFADHSVREIAHAASDNLTSTTDCLVRTIQDSQANKIRTICFVTGVPGAGKTLTGLSAVHDPSIRKDGRPAGIFLSGNGPLVKIVREALSRNTALRESRPKEAINREVSTFIQNVHSFLKEYGIENKALPSFEQVVVFDEAQRAWDANQLKKKQGVDQSEAELFLEIMERTPEWCVIVALIGGGQEIHDGEGGLIEWASALKKREVPWRVMVSPGVYDDRNFSLASNRLTKRDLQSPSLEIIDEPLLHLSVSVRNIRSELVSEWVNHIIENETEEARRIASDNTDCSIVITRDLDLAREWLRERTYGERRFGLLSSSGSLRHRAHGLEVSSSFRSGYPFVEWFLSPDTDVRSSCQLEVAATEFECQGLELDFVCVAWGDDLCIDPITKQWEYRQFRGSGWKTLRKESAKRYLLNKYRVLLTRAREGMIVWVPLGSETDVTRSPKLLDSTYDYLVKCGAEPLC